LTIKEELAAVTAHMHLPLDLQLTLVFRARLN